MRINAPLRTLARAVTVAGLLSCSALACNRETLDAAPSVDLARFQGKWFEVAHLPRPTQRDCSGTTATYTMQADGQLKFVHECTLGDGSYHGSTAMARVADPVNPAKLEVDFGGFTGDYWILSVAPDYRYAVVGHPSRDYLWILSRTPQMTDADKQLALSDAQSRSFDTSKLEFTAQPVMSAQGTPAPASTYGCNLGFGGSSAEGIGIAALAVAGAARRRKQA